MQQPERVLDRSDTNVDTLVEVSEIRDRGVKDEEPKPMGASIAAEIDRIIAAFPECGIEANYKNNTYSKSRRAMINGLRAITDPRERANKLKLYYEQ